jgi:hypothetical protein
MIVLLAEMASRPLVPASDFRDTGGPLNSKPILPGFANAETILGAPDVGRLFASKIEKIEVE